MDDLTTLNLSPQPGAIVFGKGDIMETCCLNKLKDRRISFTNIPQCIRSYNCLKMNHYHNVK